MHAPVRLLLVGATGMVGRHLLAQALNDPRVAAVTAPARRVLPAHPKLSSPLVDFDSLPDVADWWQADAAICTLGTTLRAAGSKAAFRRVDHDHPLAIARLTRAAGTPVYVLNSAIGADAASRFFYNRTKGELEQALTRVGFESLTFVRPGVIGGRREEFRPGERALAMTLGLIGPLLPRAWRINPAPSIARELLEAALRPAAGVHLVLSERMI